MVNSVVTVKISSRENPGLTASSSVQSSVPPRSMAPLKSPAGIIVLLLAGLARCEGSTAILVHGCHLQATGA